MRTNMVKLGEHIFVAVGCRESLHIFNDGSHGILGSAISPLPPIPGHVTGGGERIAHQNIVCTHGLLGIVGVVTIGIRMPLMET